MSTTTPAEGDASNASTTTTLPAKKRDKGAFKFKHFTIRHDLCGMKVDESKGNKEVWEGNVGFKEDEHITDIHTNDPSKEPRRILEIGCGSGVITLLLTHRYRNAIIDSIDIDEGAIKQALYNIEHCPIPTVQSRIRLFHCPAQEFTSPPLNSTQTTTTTTTTTTTPTSTESTADVETDSEEPTRDKQHNLNTFFKYPPSMDVLDNTDGIYDLIICAPPYFKSDESTEDMILRMKDKRRIARHTHTLLMEELADVVFTLLKKNTGKFRTIFSLPYPADVFQLAAPSKGLQCVEKVHVRDNPGEKAPVRLMETYIATQKPPSQDNSTSSETTPNPPTSPPPTEHQFSIYTASYQEMPVMHRPYTNQYKFLVKDFCIHFLNK